MANKKYLDQAGLERLVNYLHNELNAKANTEDVPSNEDLNNAGFINQDDLILTLNNYVTNNTLNELKNSLNTVYRFKGTISDRNALNTIQNPEIGDVYNLADSGMNVAWTGEVWDDFGSIADLSNYLLEDDIVSIELSTIDSMLYSGSRAVVEDINSLRSMIDNNEPKVTVSLNKNLQLNEAINIPEDKEVILNLNGNKISASGYAINCAGGKLILENGDVESNGRPVLVSSGGQLLINDANITSVNDVAISVSGENSKVTMNSGNVSAQESGILITTNGQLELNGGQIECFDNCPIQGNGTPGQGNVDIVMNGGKLIAHIQSAGYTACGVYLPNSGKFTMNGGSIESEGAGIVMRAGQVDLNGGTITATGATGIRGKVGDSKVTIGPYAVVYDEKAKYPGAAEGLFKLTIGKDMVLQGTDGDLECLLTEGVEANIIDNRE